MIIKYFRWLRILKSKESRLGSLSLWMLVVQMDGILIKLLRSELIEMIHRVYPLEPAEAHYFGEVAKRYRYVGTNVEVGFITSVSESFCSSCTRARISADGKFYTCLFATEGLDLRELLREIFRMRS